MNELIRRGNKFFARHTVTCYETDAAFQLKPSAFMDLAQEIAMLAADGIGYGYDDLMASRHAWVLSRMHFHINRPPKWRDEVILSTWHKGFDGLFSLRDFLMETPEGEPLVTCTTSWLVIDIDLRRLIRDPFGPDVDPGKTSDLSSAIAEPAPKIMIPKGLERVDAGFRVSSFSDIDILGHTNNVRYVVWSMDAMPYEEVSRRPVMDVCINFNKETLQGEKVQLQTAREGDTVYVEGLFGGLSKFTAKFDF